MGFISDLAKDKGVFRNEKPRNLWREAFGGTNKEEGFRQPPVGGGSWGRSITTNTASYKRLLEAYRSMAPGGWSDDRWTETKQFVGIAYISIHRTGEQLAQSEFQIFQKDESHQDGKRPVSRDHPGYKLYQLLERPNDEDDFGDLMYEWNLQMDLTGQALTWMVPNKFGIPYEMYPIPTAMAIPQPTTNPDYPGGYYRIQPIYPYGPFSTYPTPNSAVGAAIPREWMLQFKYKHPFLRYDGYSPLTGLALHMDEVQMIDRSRHYMMRRSINPSAVLNFEDSDSTIPLDPNEIERIRAEFEADYQGPENAGRLFVATPGASLDPWGGNPKDMEYQAGWEQLSSFVMAGFGITKPAAGMVEDSSYSTLFATIKQLHLLTLEPKVNRIARKLTRHLAPYFGEDLIVEIKCRRIDDRDLINSKVDRLVQARAITKNELRMEMDMPLTKDPWGNEIAGTDPQPPQGMPGQVPGMPMGSQAIPGQPIPDQIPGMEGMPQTPDLGELLRNSGAGGLAELLAGGDLQQQEMNGIERERPGTGRLGLGALGPRKSLRYVYKSLKQDKIVKKLVKICEKYFDKLGPDYNKLYINESTNDLYYVTFDGDDGKVVNQLFEELGSVDGVGEVDGDAETLPKGDEWVCIYDRNKNTKGFRGKMNKLLNGIHKNGAK